MKWNVLNSAGDLGEWVQAELSRAEPDTVHITRVITQEIGRWFTQGLSDDDIRAVAAPAADTGSKQWDALIEGVVSHQLHVRDILAPDWTRRTKLDAGWAPNEHLTRDLRWHILNVFSTPVELLDKGVVFARENLSRL